MNKKILLPLVGSVVLLIGIFIMAAKIYQKGETQKANFMAQENAQAFVRPHSPTLGPDDAKVYLVEFMDPECESCRATFSPVKKLLEDYPGKIKLVIRYVPFHANSKFAIKILEAARKQGKYWETLDLLFRYQPDWGDHHSPRPELIWDYLPQVGLNIDQIKQDLEDPATDQIIHQDFEDAKALGVRATPTFFVNGKPLEAFGMDYLREAVQKAVDE